MPGGVGKYAEAVELSRQIRRTSVVSTVERAVRGTGGRVGAERRVPGVAGVAVGAAGDVVEPTPVGVEDDGALQG